MRNTDVRLELKLRHIVNVMFNMVWKLLQLLQFLQQLISL